MQVWTVWVHFYMNFFWGVVNNSVLHNMWLVKFVVTELQIWQNADTKGWLCIMPRFSLHGRLAFLTLSCSRVCCTFFFFFFFFFFFLWAPIAHRSSQARDQIGGAAASHNHSHSNARSELHLWPMPQPTEQGQGSNPCPQSTSLVCYC